MIETERLKLRGWMESDLASFHAMGQDPEVMRYLGPPMSMSDVEAAATRQNGFLADLGYCFWAIERKADHVFLGFCGVKPGAKGTPIENRMEIGWRLARSCWGHGYAREAAQASLDRAWATSDADRIWAITTAGNERSWGLMERLGMTRHADLDFEHPEPGLADWLKPHITYSIGRPT